MKKITNVFMSIILSVLVAIPFNVFAFTSECTGGTITNVGANTVHTFTSSGTFECSSAGTGNVDYLVVAGGGGGGGANSAGGGGAGGVRMGTSLSFSGSSSVTVGSGGTGGADTGVTGSNGSDSVWNSIISIGGSGGGGNTAPSNAGTNGGSGGGNAGFGTGLAGSGIVGQGNDGGVGADNPFPSGGGGGAGSTGQAGTGFQSGSGGAGIVSSISGSAIYYGGGGGGGSSSQGSLYGLGGIGGGGNGGELGNPTLGVANTGGGGGGSGSANTVGASGGSGIVILSYVTPVYLPPITGTGINNRLAKFSSATTITNSLLSDDGLNISLTSGNLFISNGSLFSQFISLLADGLGLDTDTPRLLSIGSTTATSINIGRANVTTTIFGTTKISNIGTVSNCVSTITPAVCGSAPSGSVAMSTGGSTLIVNTTAVTSDSQIFVIEDASLGARLGITCSGAGANRSFSISARTANTSYTIKSSGNITGANKACLSYFIVN
ncbi:MAG: glycine-rich domain-containing protein [Minisyncoccia bacterium]